MKPVYVVRRVIFTLMHGATDNSDDLDLGMADERPPLIPPGEYEVGYVRASKRWLFNREVTYLYFKIVTPGPFEGKELYMPVRTSPRKGQKTMAHSSKLVRAISLALGGAPMRLDRLSTASFKGKFFKASIVTVQRDAAKRKLTIENQYSVIDMLLEKVAG